MNEQIQAIRQEIAAMLGAGMIQGLQAVRALRYIENNEAEVLGYLNSDSVSGAADLVLELSK